VARDETPGGLTSAHSRLGPPLARRAPFRTRC
jgi:hypothetical protein